MTMKLVSVCSHPCQYRRQMYNKFCTYSRQFLWLVCGDNFCVSVAVIFLYWHPMNFMNLNCIKFYEPLG
jgi:hypothetical protein